MKKFTYFSVIIATLLFSFFGVSDFSNGKEDAKRKYTYKPLINSNKQFTANEALEFKNMLYTDAVSGKIEHQKLADARTQVKQMMLAKSSNLSFIEDGPDNIGGRTRVLQFTLTMIVLCLQVLFQVDYLLQEIKEILGNVFKNLTMQWKIVLQVLDP